MEVTQTSVEEYAKEWSDYLEKSPKELPEQSVFVLLSLFVVAEYDGLTTKSLFAVLVRIGAKFPWLLLRIALERMNLAERVITSKRPGFLNLLNFLDAVAPDTSDAPQRVLLEKTALICELKLAREWLDTPNPKLEQVLPRERLARFGELVRTGYLAATYNKIREELTALRRKLAHGLAIEAAMKVPSVPLDAEVVAYLHRLAKDHGRGDGGQALQKITAAMAELPETSCTHIEGRQLSLITHLRKAGTLPEVPSERATRAALRRLARNSPLFERRTQRTWVYHLDQLRAPSEDTLRKIRAKSPSGAFW